MNFDVILCVVIERFEHFDDIDSDIDVDVAKKINEKANEQLNATIATRFDEKSRVISIAAIFVCFDVILSVAIERCEHFDDIDADVAKEIDETSETDEADEQTIVDFFLILYVNSDVENRKFDLICCSRM